MASRFWVGGDGTWNTTSTTNWATTTGGASGASAPTAADQAIFDANSGSSYTVTLGENVTVQAVTASAAVSLTLDFGSNKITVTGNNGIVYRASGIVEYLGTPVVDFTYTGSTGTRSITPGAASVTNPVSINVVSGTDIIALTAGTSGRYTDLDFTGFAGTLAAQTSATSIFGNVTFSAGMTITSATGIYVFSATSGTQQITTNGKTLDMPLTFGGVGGTFAFQDALTQGSTRAFTIANGTVQLKNGVTSTVGSFVANNANVKFLQSTTPGSQATLSQASGTVNASNLTIKDINATGGATWNAFTTNGNIDAGNNLGWDFSSQVGRYIYTRRKNKRILP